MQRLFNPQRYRHVQRLVSFQQSRTARFATMSAAETDTQAAQAANTSGITPASLTTTLTEALEAKHVDINDISGGYQSLLQMRVLSLIEYTGGCGQAFEAVIVSPQFTKKTTLARHRLVNSALKTEIAAIHAWTPKCFTPEEWEKRQGS